MVVFEKRNFNEKDNRAALFFPCKKISKARNEWGDAFVWTWHENTQRLTLSINFQVADGLERIETRDAFERIGILIYAIVAKVEMHF